jgi:hypothetical protein
MIESVLRWAHRLDAWLHRRFGRPYHAILGLGLLIEIGRHVHELGELRDSPTRIVRVAFQLIFYSVLLVHQLGELYAHTAARRLARDQSGPR